MLEGVRILTMVGVNDVIGALLIVVLLVVVLWRIFEVRLDHKIRKKVDEAIRDNERNKMDDDVCLTCTLPTGHQTHQLIQAGIGTEPGRIVH